MALKELFNEENRNTTLAILLGIALVLMVAVAVYKRGGNAVEVQVPQEPVSEDVPEESVPEIPEVQEDPEPEAFIPEGGIDDSMHRW